jgi:hypothetical protein
MHMMPCPSFSSRNTWGVTSYNIIVPKSQPLKDIIRNREASRQIGK